MSADVPRFFIRDRDNGTWFQVRRHGDPLHVYYEAPTIAECKAWIEQEQRLVALGDTVLARMAQGAKP
jgi:hypothetical protein